jgi:hypothetical protein
MANAEDLIEANRRGLLTGQIKTDFDAAVGRGLISIPAQGDSITPKVVNPEFTEQQIETMLPPVDSRFASNAQQPTPAESDQLSSGFTPSSVSSEILTRPPMNPAETRAAANLPELGEAGILFDDESFNEMTAPNKLIVGSALLTAGSDQEVAKILGDLSPNIGITTDPGGNMIATNNKTGAAAILNRPGISRIDILRGLGVGALFTPASMAATVGTAGLKATAGIIARRGAQAGATSGAIESGVQAVEEQAGGTFDKGQVLLSTALGAIGEPVGEAVNIAAKPVASALKPKIDAGGEILKSALKKGVVLTSDILPPKTAIGGAVQKVLERIPLIGTGPLRANQQASRVKAVENMASDFGVDIRKNINRDIVKSVAETFNKSVEKGFKFRNEAVETLTKASERIKLRPKNTVKEIEKQINSQLNLGTSGNSELIQDLTNLKAEMKGSFSDIVNQRSALNNKALNTQQLISTGDEAVLKSVSRAISKDLNEYGKVIQSRSKHLSGIGISKKDASQAIAKWKASNRIIRDNFTKTKQTKLKSILSKGELTPEIVDSLILGGKKSDIVRLFGNISKEGREDVADNLIGLAFERSITNDAVDPNKFLNFLDKQNVRVATDKFFSGAKRKELEGVKKFLELTKRAQSESADVASNQTLTGIGLAGAATVEPVSLLAVAITGAAARAFEGKAVRNLMIKLADAKPNSNSFKLLSDRIKSILIASEREE